MESPGWRRRRGSSPAARRGARQRAGLTLASASNTLSVRAGDASLKTWGAKKTLLTLITVSTAIASVMLCER